MHPSWRRGLRPSASCSTTKKECTRYFPIALFAVVIAVCTSPNRIVSGNCENLLEYMSSILFITVMKCRLKTRFPVVVVVFISAPAQGPICSLRVIVKLVVRIHHCIWPDTQLTTATTSNRLKSRGESINSLYLA